MKNVRFFKRYLSYEGFFPELRITDTDCRPRKLGLHQAQQVLRSSVPTFFSLNEYILYTYFVLFFRYINLNIIQYRVVPRTLSMYVEELVLTIKTRPWQGSSIMTRSKWSLLMTHHSSLPSTVFSHLNQQSSSNDDTSKKLEVSSVKPKFLHYCKESFNRI